MVGQVLKSMASNLLVEFYAKFYRWAWQDRSAIDSSDNRRLMLFISGQRLDSMSSAPKARSSSRGRSPARVRSPKRPGSAAGTKKGGKSSNSTSERRWEAKVTNPFVKFLLDFRWIAVIFVVLPLSWLVFRYNRIRDWWLYEVRQHRIDHAKKVEGIKEQLRKYRESGSTAKLCTARANWATTSLRYPTYKGRLLLKELLK